jgi:GntR family transcriptional regulator, transcriptional repressor for pyruvate dehydrogenase complex
MAGTADGSSHARHTPRSSIQLAPIAVPKASDVLADDLRERILSGEFAEGTPLPPERELVVQTNMSRATVREALRVLEAQGLLRIKAGRAGGAFVRHPGKDSVASSVGMLIRGQRIRLAAVLETREAIEPSCARLAARNRTDADLAVLDGANEAIVASRDLDAFLRANVDWHVAVATATHNEILAGMMTALSQAIYTATNNERFIDSRIRDLTARAHRSITEAVRAQDPDAAVRRMSRHMHAYAEAALADEERAEISVPDPL